MKKLLMLGGTRYLVPVIQQAKKLGYYTITCDYLPNNISHKYSDDYHNVSIVEKEKVLELAESLSVDGVMSFACDPGVTTAAYVAEKMDLPAPGPYESVALLQNKGAFRHFLTENGFHVPRAASFQRETYSLEHIESFRFPLIVKPTDSAGSKGVSKVERVQDLEKAIEFALSYSRGEEFIIEEFIESQGFSSDSDCFSIDGELKFVSFSSQRFDANAENPYTPAAYSWPSSMTGEQEAKLRSELQRLLKLLHMRSSLYNVETRVGKDGKPYIMEVSPRAGGNRIAEMLHYATGTDLITKAIQASLGETINPDFSEYYNGHWAEVILHTEQAGLFEKLWVSDKIRDYVVEEDLWVERGTKIYPFKAANEAIGTLILRFPTSEELNEVMRHIDSFVQVKVQ